MITLPSRPFARELVTGLMLPDGIFESTIGNQELVAGFRNGGTTTPFEAYVESTSHPSLVVSPATRSVGSLVTGATTFLSWRIDVSAVPPGEYLVSFVIDTPAGRERRIKKIFVTRVTFDPATKTFTAETPQGRLGVVIGSLVQPIDQQCCPPPGRDRESSFLQLAQKAFSGHDPEFRACLPGYLLETFTMAVQPSAPWPGQYGPLPFEDPWWKVILCIIAVLLLIAAGIAAAVSGSGSVSVSSGTPTSPSPVPPCCGVTASGGSSSYVAAGLVAAAAAAATAAALSDVRDPVRRGQDNTIPAEGELTTAEKVEVMISYPEPIALGTPFKVGATWKYERQTTGDSYTYSAEDETENIHVVTEERITAPDVVRVYQEDPFLVQAEFFDAGGAKYVGSRLFVQCILAGPHGEYLSLPLEDSGRGPDSAVDGTYTGRHFFSGREAGVWRFYVIAQDVNEVAEGTAPEDAAQVIGGVVVSHSLTISFDGGSCPLVPDGFVQVIAES
jgi:hypothetical protein